MEKDILYLFPKPLTFFFASIVSFFAAVVSLTVQTLSFVFSNLPSLVASVPLPLHRLFLEAEKKIAQHSRHLRLVGLPLWAMLGCLIESLEDLEALEQISGLTLDRGAKEPLSLLAECLLFVIGVPQKVGSEVNATAMTLKGGFPVWMGIILSHLNCTTSGFISFSHRSSVLSDRVFPNPQCTKCCRLWRSKDQSG